MPAKPSSSTWLAVGLAVLVLVGLAWPRPESRAPAPEPVRSAALQARIDDTFKPSGAGWTTTLQQGVLHFVALSDDAARQEDAYRTAAARLCGTAPVCQVAFWIGSAPQRMPMSDAEVAAEVARYRRNTNTGLNEWIGDCARAPGRPDC